MDANQVVSGFSLTNRLLLYASILLAPAQLVAGVGNNIPINIGFLGYNWYTQYQWYINAQSGQLQALSLLLVHFNLIYTITYISGVGSGNLYVGIPAGLGSAGVIVLNTISAWVSWKTDLPAGDGVYQFFFFGWRTLTPGWRTFFLIWQIGDTISALTGVVTAIALGIAFPLLKDEKKEYQGRWHLPKWIAWLKPKSWSIMTLRYPAIPVGAALMLLAIWPLVLWVELIVARNNISSDTDWIAVWLFIGQVGTLIMPDLEPLFCCLVRRIRGKEKEEEKDGAA
jgi:hypothetical protein